MKEYQSPSHTRWDCKYHVVFIPKRRKKRIFGVLRQHLGEVFHELASHKESKNSRRAPDGRSRSYLNQCSSEIRGARCSGVYQGEKRDSDCPAVWRETEEFYGRELLGPRVFRLYGRIRRKYCSVVHPESGRGRRAVRTDEVCNGVSRLGRLTISGHRLYRWCLTY